MIFQKNLSLITRRHYNICATRSFSSKGHLPTQLAHSYTAPSQVDSFLNATNPTQKHL